MASLLNASILNNSFRRKRRRDVFDDDEDDHLPSNIKDPLAWARPASPSQHDVPTHHARYYFDDNLAVLQVENKLFKVHRYFLQRESVVFGDMFSFKQPPGSKDALDDAHPIVLEGVTVKEMEALLNHFYHGMDDNRTRSLDEWIALLNITHRFQFEDLCTRAVIAIDTASPSLDPVKKVLLGQRLGLTRLTLSGYVHLCARNTFVSAEEGELLGGRATALLGHARERVQKEVTAMGFGTMSRSPEQRVKQIVQEVFKLQAGL